MQNGTATLEDSLAVPYKAKHALITYDLAIVLFGIHPNKLKSYVHTKPCTRIFIAGLFIIVKTWKQPRCPPTGEWINKMWYIFIQHKRKWVIKP